MLHDLFLAQRHLESAERFGEGGWVSDGGHRFHQAEGGRQRGVHLGRHGSRAHRRWRKLHLAVDPGSGEILASDLTNNEGRDASLVGPLLNRSARPIGLVPANGTDDGQSVYRAVATRSQAAELIIPPHPSAVPSAAFGSAPRGDR